jgi:hypothetical protein
MSLEHVEMADPNWGRIAEKVYQSYDNACITRIEKVIMDRTEFSQRLEKVEKKIGTKPQVVEMFHGTKVKNVEGILATGFRVSENKVSAYGKGTYFSPSAQFSLSGYTDASRDWGLSYVFLCDINMEDTGGDKSHIYVCPRDDSCIPTYLISFYKDANKIK